MIPPPVRIEPFSDLDSGILDARVSQLAPNGLKISMGSSAERRRQLVANLLPSINVTDFKDDDSNSNKVDEKSDDSKVDEKSDDKAGVVNDGSSHKVDEKSEEEDRDVISVNIDEKSEEQDEYTQTKSSKCLRFLVVDDTAATRKLMRRVLTSAGHTVDEAEDGYGYGPCMILLFF
jgi:PleD family two-component response regulator